MYDHNPILQVALDFENLTDAEKIAKMLQRELGDVKYICEAGTPLIKNEGLKTVIPRLRSVVGSGTKIVADLKTMDTGAFEVDLARKAGADVASVAGAAEEETIDAALARAKEIGMEMMVDTIGTAEISGRLELICKKLEKYVAGGGKAVLEYHIPIDAQTKARNFGMLKEIHNRFRIPLAVACGLDENTIPEVLGYGVNICVVGGTITRPKQRTSEEALRKIKEVIYK